MIGDDRAGAVRRAAGLIIYIIDLRTYVTDRQRLLYGRLISSCARYERDRRSMKSLDNWQTIGRAS
jgi:hypothetical protein